MRFLLKSYKVGKLALHAHHGVFSLCERSRFGRQGITKATLCSGETEQRDPRNDL